MRRLMIVGVAMMMMTGAMGAKPVAHVDFESLPVGKASGAQLKSLWEKPQWAAPYDRASIVEDKDAARGKVLRVLYPAGKFGPAKNGMQFLVSLPPSDELWLSYWVKFEKGFDFKMGGKMPGLTSGGGKFTGGHHPTKGEGWSARYMWGRNGSAIVYFYSVDMPGKWGQGLKLKGAKFVPGKWHRMVQHIKINTGDNSDGVLQVWLDGKKVYEDKAERFRLGDQGRIDSFYFSTFHGGGSAKWAPTVDSAARYDDILITREAPEGLEK